jgi:hypothetical protein
MWRWRRLRRDVAISSMVVAVASGAGPIAAAGATRPSVELTGLIGVPRSAVAARFGAAAHVRTVRSSGNAASLKLSYPALGLTLVLSEQGSRSLTVAAAKASGRGFRVAGVRIGMTERQLLHAAGHGVRCSALSCSWTTVAGRASARLRRGRVVSVGVTAPRVVAVARGTVVSSATVPATTRVLPGNELRSVTGTAGGMETVTFGPGSAASLAVGDIVVLGITSSTRYGLMGRITSIRPSGNTVTVKTRPATLLEAIPTGAINVKTAFSDRQIKPTHGVRQIRGKAATAGYGFSQGIATSLGCGKASVSVSGSAGVTPTFIFNASWGGILHPSVQHATFEASVDENVQLSAQGHASASCTPVSKTLFTHTFTPFTVFVGPVPVVFVPKLELDLDSHASLSADLSATVGQQLTASGGVSYNEGSFSPIHSLSNSFTWQPPSPLANASLDAGVTAKLSLLVDDLVGPNVALTPSLDLEVTPGNVAPSPWWTLSGILDGNAGLHVSVLNLNYDTPNLIHFSKVLASGSRQPTQPPPAPSPTPSPTPPPPVSATPPVFSGFVTLSGATNLTFAPPNVDTQPGDVLTCSLPPVSGNPTPTVQAIWYLVNSQTGQVTTTTQSHQPFQLEITQDMYGAEVYCNGSATNTAGTTTVGPPWNPPAVSAVWVYPPTRPQISYTGSFTIGNTVTASLTPGFPGSPTYQANWECSMAGTQTTVGTGFSYTIQPADGGCLLSLQVSAFYPDGAVPAELGSWQPVS